MSFRPGLLPHLLRPTKAQNFSAFTRSFHRPPPFTHQAASRTLTLARPISRSSRALFPLLAGTAFLGYSALSSPAKCESPIPTFASGPRPEVGAGNPPIQSEISGYQLGFGAVCGICTGVFVKKGLKAIAFLLGGVFILMQVSDLSTDIPLIFVASPMLEQR